MPPRAPLDEPPLIESAYHPPPPQPAVPLAEFLGLVALADGDELFAQCIGLAEENLGDLSHEIKYDRGLVWRIARVHRMSFAVAYDALQSLVAISPHMAGDEAEL
ncbi:unnamed protein product, partial [Mesorhabditis spiculigera]